MNSSCSLFSPNYVPNNYVEGKCLTLTCMIYLIYQIRLPIVIGALEWCLLMAHKNINSLTTIIFSILFPLARLK